MVFAPVCNGEVAGSNPAKSNKLLGKKFNQEALINFCGKLADEFGCASH